MSASAPAHAAAFRTLARRLAARRWRALGARGRVLLALLGAIVAGFAYWQLHGPLAGIVRAQGVRTGFAVVGAWLATIAVAGGALAASQRARFAAAPPGPEWLALPVPPGRVVAHLRGEARWTGALAFAPAAGVFAASASRLPWFALPLLVPAFALAWWLATAAGDAIAWRAALVRTRTRRALPATTRALLAATRTRGGRTHAAPRWRTEPAWRALARLDALLTRRGAAARGRFAGAMLAAIAGLAAWAAPAPPVGRRAMAFVGFALASGCLGSWSIVRATGDPESAMRPLPLGLASVWRARATTLALALLALAAANAIAAVGFPPAARLAQFATWFVPGLAVALLALHVALTLGNRTSLAEGLYTGWLGIAMVASLMVPLLGWFVLAGGLVHATLRLPRWWRPEVG